MRDSIGEEQYKQGTHQVRDPASEGSIGGEPVGKGWTSRGVELTHRSHGKRAGAFLPSAAQRLLRTVNGAPAPRPLGRDMGGGGRHSGAEGDGSTERDRLDARALAGAGLR